MTRTKIKFCGCRSERDVENAARAGADAIGFIFAPSPRRVGYRAAAKLLRVVPPGILPVAVFVKPSADEIQRVAELRDDIAFQMTADGVAQAALPSAAVVIQTMHVDAAGTYRPLEAMFAKPCDRIVLFDTKVSGADGGTGRTFPWDLIAPFVRRQPAFVAGGLTVANVGNCIRLLRPYGVDVSTGIETLGTKDPMKMRDFVDAVRSADAD